MLFRGFALLSAVLSAVLTAVTGSSWWWLPAWFAGAFLALFLLAFLFVFLVSQCIDVSKPQEHDSPFHRSIVHLCIDALIPLCRVHIHTQGMEKLPKEGRFLLVCNHLGNPDPVVLLHCFRSSQLAFISKRENQDMFIIGKLMHKLLCQLINRENDREALKTILRCIQILKEDKASIAVFPEGKATPDGTLYHFRSGVFKIAQKTGVPIVVCTIQNTPQLLHNIPRLKPTHIPVHLVDVIRPEEYKGMNTVEIASMVYEKMISDLGESFREE